MAQAERRVGVGVGVIVTRGDAVVMVQRRYRKPGSWSFPGGYLDFGETPETCAIREVAEETGLTITDPVFIAVTNDLIDAERHNITLWFTAKAATGEIDNHAPDELLTVAWFPHHALPSPLFPSTANFLAGRSYPRFVTPSPVATGEGAGG